MSDLWCTAQRVANVVERHWNASSLTFAVQDGAAAGQTVDHVHVHVMPRKAGDFANNDDIYTAIEDDKSQARSLDAMAAEADELRALFDASERFPRDSDLAELEFAGDKQPDNGESNAK